MKKGVYLIALVCICLLVGGCGTKYKGYWCNYNETATIVVLLEKNNTEKDRAAIEKKIESFDNVEASNYYSRDDYAEELGGDVENMDIYDTYVVSFASMDSVGTYVEELSKMNGVLSSEQSNAKTNIALYNLKKGGKYTFTNSDEALEEDLETGKYKIKKGVITFTPEKNGNGVKILYTKDGLLCADTECEKIFARSNSTCSAEEE